MLKFCSQKDTNKKMRREAILGKKIFSTQCQTKDLQSKYKEDSYKSVRNSPFFRKKWLKNLDTSSKKMCKWPKAHEKIQVSIILSGEQFKYTMRSHYTALRLARTKKTVTSIDKGF